MRNKRRNLERPDVTLEQRVAIGVDLLVKPRYHGRVTDLAERLAVSRETVYAFARNVVVNLVIVAELCFEPVLGKERDEELLSALQILGEPLSADAIRELSKRTLGYKRSPNFYQGIGQLAGEVAKAWLQDVGRTVRQAALDETFPHDVMLTAVEPSSLACLGLRLLGEQPLNRGAWSEFLEQQLPQLEYAASDEGKALKAALKGSGVARNSDYTHVSARLGLACKRAEKLAARAFAKLEKAEAVYRKTTAANGQKLLFPDAESTEELKQAYEEALQWAERLLEAWESAEEAHRLVHRAYRYTRGSRVATVEEARVDLLQAIELLMPYAKVVREMGTAATYLRGVLPTFGTFLARLAKTLEAHGPAGEQAFLVVRRERQGRSREASDQAWAALWATDLDDDRLLDALVTIEANYDRLLGTCARSSASVEHLHSRFAPYVAVSDRLSQERWHLVAFRLNATPFQEGKRRGMSPFEILGVNLGKHWSEALLERIRQRFPQSLNNLLTRGCLPSGWTPPTEDQLGAIPGAVAQRQAAA
jgi:hypothetical protein